MNFKNCTTCKTPIPFGGRYYKCSVSTCNRRATALYFCSVPCWDAHVPDAKHRDAWAEVETAPSGLSAESPQSDPSVRRKVAPTSSTEAAAGSATTDDEALPIDVLVVLSKIKSYIKARSDLRTSDGVSDPLSDHLRQVCTNAIRSAAKNNRTTVLARDIEAVLRGESAAD